MHGCHESDKPADLPRHRIGFRPDSPVRQLAKTLRPSPYAGQYWPKKYLHPHRQRVYPGTAFNGTIGLGSENSDSLRPQRKRGWSRGSSPGTDLMKVMHGSRQTDNRELT
jgi:hypothetical protein